MNKTRVVIIDDHSMFIQGLSLVISSHPDYQVSGCASCIADSIALVERERPALALIDLNLGEEDGLDLIKSLHERYPETRLLALSMLNERYYAERTLAAGARGYVMKEEAAETLFEAMNAVVSGKIWLSKEEQSRFLDAAFSGGSGGRDRPKNDIADGLSDRQLQILRLLGKGDGTADIASKLDISRKTVESHKEQLKKRLGCASSQELLRLAIEWAARVY